MTSSDKPQELNIQAQHFNLKCLPREVKKQLHFIEVRENKAEWSEERAGPPTRLTMQQVAKLQKMADVAGLTGYDVLGANKRSRVSTI